MIKVTLLACLALPIFPAMADPLTCDALKARVDAKLQDKGVPSYSLEIQSIVSANTGTAAASAIPATKASQGKEVGTCDGGKKRLIYTRGN